MIIFKNFKNNLGVLQIIKIDSAKKLNFLCVIKLIKVQLFSWLSSQNVRFKMSGAPQIRFLGWPMPFSQENDSRSLIQVN